MKEISTIILPPLFGDEASCPRRHTKSRATQSWRSSLLVLTADFLDNPALIKKMLWLYCGRVQRAAVSTHCPSWQHSLKKGKLMSLMQTVGEHSAHPAPADQCPAPKEDLANQGGLQHSHSLLGSRSQWEFLSSAHVSRK